MNYAGLGSRFIALVIDYVILVIIGFLLSQIVGSDILGIGVGFLIGILYNWYFWTRNNGQTPGKQVMGLRVVKTDGSKINDLEAVIRYVGYYINTFLLFLGWLWAIPDGKNQGLHDKLAGTVVVKA
jgi:uncharacterized RDD family membrane protein YckC